MTQAQQVGSGVPALSVRFAEESNIGLRKKEQQDYQGHLYIAPEEHGDGPLMVFVVCDGVSMGMAGALASRTAVEVILQNFPDYLSDGYAPLMALKSALEDANSEVVQLAADRPGMATTCVAVLLISNQLYVAHVGDSRAYLVCVGQSPTLLTTDHSWTEEFGRTMVRQGLMSDDELRHDGRRHSITRAMGLENEISFDFNQQTLQPTDRILLCSDGLWDAVEVETLAHLVCHEQGNQSEPVLPQVAHNLIEAALAAGGRDNITVSLLEVDEVGQPDGEIATSILVQETQRNIQTRTGQNLPFEEEDQSDKPTIQIELPTASAKTIPAIPLRELDSYSQPLFVPTQPNEDVMFKRAQKLYALGHFDEAMEQMLDLEQLNSERPGLYEMMSNSLVRVVASAETRGDLEFVTKLFTRLEQANIGRYREILFDFCMQESQEAVQARSYVVTQDYATLALLLHPNDNRPRHLLDLSEAYLDFQRDDLPLAERLKLGQNLYARDPDFGGIQDDLARIYLELGDEAAAIQALQEAIEWYQMVRGLRPRDTRVYSLAIGKQRSLEDTLQRQAEQAATDKELDLMTAAATKPDPSQENATDPKPEEMEEFVPDLDGINRLKERVSRTQKAWDNGRREVGSDYIYLVEKLNSMLSPNPWQPTYPRVCYDYGKWLFEQHQYREAKPYFEKASDLGVGAAQQKLREIERLEEAGEIDINTGMAVSRLSQAAKTLTARVAAEPDSSLETQPNSSNLQNAPNPSFNFRQPFITALAELPVEKNFVGASHAGDGVLGPAGRAPRRALSPSSATTPLGPPTERAAAAPTNELGAADSGSDMDASPLAGLGIDSPTRRAAKYVKTERSVGATGLRTPVNANTNKSLQGAVARELSRLQTTGVPQYVAPKKAARYRAMGYLDLLRSLWLPVLLGLIVLVAVSTLALALLNIKPPAVEPTTEPTSVVAAAVFTTVGTVEPSPTFAPPTITPVPTPPPIQPHVNLKFSGAVPSDFVLYLGVKSSGLKNLIPLTLTDKDNNVFSPGQLDVTKIDRSQIYFVLARPKDTSTRKYLPNLPLNNPLQALYLQSQLTFDVGYNVKANFNFGAQAAEFYPLDGGNQDGEAPGGGRYYSTTHHIVRPAFLDYYQKNGDTSRWGYPISEEFDWNGVGHVQFFERGWLLKNTDGTIVPGTSGQTLLSTPCKVNPGPVLPPPNPNATSFNTANSFTTFVTKNSVGKPVSEFFFLQVGDTRKLFQYFENGRLEVSQTAPNLPVELGLIGSEYARCQGWTT